MSKKILVLAPHTDDGELGCGGTIAKLISEGNEVFYLAFTGAEKSVPTGFPRDALRQEVMHATAKLGIPAENVDVLHFPVREFASYRQEILEKMIEIRNEMKPNMVFLPSSNDKHQDHEVISNEGFRAFKNSSVFAYELPWNTITFSTHCFVDLEEWMVERKIDSMAQYKTQQGRQYSETDFIRSWAVFRGTQCGKPFAEAFEVKRLYL